MKGRVKDKVFGSGKLMYRKNAEHFVPVNVKFADAIFSDRAVGFSRLVRIAEKAEEELIDANAFLRGRGCFHSLQVEGSTSEL